MAGGHVWTANQPPQRKLCQQLIFGKEGVCQLTTTNIWACVVCKSTTAVHLHHQCNICHVWSANQPPQCICVINAIFGMCSLPHQPQQRELRHQANIGQRMCGLLNKPPHHCVTKQILLAIARCAWLFDDVLRYMVIAEEQRWSNV